MLREYVEKMYSGRCDIYEYREVKRQNGSSVQEEAIVYRDEPCRLSYTTRLSYSGLKSADSSQSVPANRAVQQIKLFLSTDIRIKPGCKITVRQNGVEESYKNSGEPAVYRLREEIVLEKFERWV